MSFSKNENEGKTKKGREVIEGKGKKRRGKSRING
jgi:hypothetical protein